MRVRSILSGSINELSVSIRYNEKDYEIVLKQQQIEILIFILLIVLIIMCAYIAIPLIC